MTYELNDLQKQVVGSALRKEYNRLECLVMDTVTFAESRGEEPDQKTLDSMAMSIHAVLHSHQIILGSKLQSPLNLQP